ncbi:hypothetical protein L3Q70_05050 [Pseudoalteromonas sp. CF6-2]|uniref:hypothetical protein n=1 Tax=Pseudoalteromonas sp. CF6-2 TaxID=562716 RepID=UPI001F3E4F9D|nr:hypothetical protein L3Q70_05050 [Pseudoalteromonas sp. CF6-2]|tara:strand:+ start:7768 stop:8154 length:387 start_codon:yes stop_codon:yes gene_type:complete
MNSVIISLVVLAAFATYLLAHHNRFDGIRASASLSIIAYCVLYFITPDVELYSVAFFGGTFIGMSAPKRFGIFTLAISALLFSILFEYLVPLLNGYGGALGLSAFLSVCICHIGILLGAPRSKASAEE